MTSEGRELDRPAVTPIATPVTMTTAAAPPIAVQNHHFLYSGLSLKVQTMQNSLLTYKKKNGH